jgi:hypothetical protein
MREAHRLAIQVWPQYSHQFSRHDFTLPQLFACLVVREMMKLSYRKTEALLRDSPHWLGAIGMTRAPDHNTLWRAFDVLLKSRRIDRMLDLLTELFAQERLLELCTCPLTLDSTCYERRHRSRHYARVCRKMKLAEGEKYVNASEKRAETPAQVNRRRSRTVGQMPKLALAVASSCHAILAARSHIGNGSDVRTVVADAGFDSEHNHRLARLDMNVRSIIPPRIGRPSDGPPQGRYRRLMKQRFSRKADQKQYGQRAQSETVNSMMKRNFGDALRSIDPQRRKKELLLRSLTHDIMLLANRKKG